MPHKRHVPPGCGPQKGWGRESLPPPEGMVRAYALAGRDPGAPETEVGLVLLVFEALDVLPHRLERRRVEEHDHRHQLLQPHLRLLVQPLALRLVRNRLGFFHQLVELRVGEVDVVTGITAPEVVEEIVVRVTSVNESAMASTAPCTTG